jgi:hypothetical protein
MILCILEMFRGQLDAMEPLVATSEKDQASAQAGVKWGCSKDDNARSKYWRGDGIRDATFARSEPAAQLFRRTTRERL